MKEYHKIQSVYKRDPKNNNKTFIIGDYSIPEFEYLASNLWVFTEKVDGTNIRVMYEDDFDKDMYKENTWSIKFRGKTDNAQIPAFLVTKLEQTYLNEEMKNKFKEKFEDATVCLYGEGYGSKIQKGGGNYREDHDFVLFDVKIGNWWLQRQDIENIAEFLSIDVVPIIGEGTLHDMITLAKEGFKSKWGDFTAEGIVARPKTELLARSGKRIITKAKHKDFQ